MVRTSSIKQDYLARNYEEFLQKLREHEILTKTKFITRKSTSLFSSTIGTPSERQLVHWHKHIPYFHFGTKVFVCHLSDDAHKATKVKHRNAVDAKAMKNPNSVKQYKRILSKKVGCPAFINVTKALMFPDYRLEGVITDHRKAEASKTIHLKVSTGEIQGEEFYIFNLPPEEAHKYHVTGEEAALVEPVDPRVRQHIRELVQHGERDALVVSHMLSNFVETELQELDRTRRRFYPDLRTVRKMVCLAKRSVKSSHIDSTDDEYPVSVGEDMEGLFEIVMEEEENSELRESRTQQLVEHCNSSLHSIQASLEFMDVSSLQVLSNSLDRIFKGISKKVVEDLGLI